MSQSRRNFKLKTREKEQSQRQLRASQELHKVLSDCFRKNARLDIRLHSYPLNITKVNISADFKIVNCFFLPFNTQFTVEDIIDALELSKFHIRDYVTRNVNLKFSPEIKFYYDSTFENINKIEQLLGNNTKHNNSKE